MSLIDAIKAVLGDLSDRKLTSFDEGKTIRVDSAYGPGDFSFRPDGKLEQASAGFIGHEEKICKIKVYDIDEDVAQLIQDYII